MNIIDLHCDTISRLYDSKEKKELYKNDFHIDIEKLKRGNSKAQFFALYMDLEAKYKKGKTAFDHCLGMLDRFYNEIEKNSEHISIARNYDEMEKNYNEGKMSAFLTIEEGGVLEGNLYNLRNFYRLGVRLITLTWNYTNCIGYSSFEYKNNHKGLTEFGRDVVKEMNRLGMIIDVSHLSDRGFYDVAELSTKPFIASHSDARNIQEHERNLTDDMLKIIGERGGVSGINFCIPFLGNSKEGRVEDMVKHITHMKNIGGIELPALGSDFDGIGGKLEISNIGEMDKLYHGLSKAGFSEDDIEKIFYKNAERVIKEVL